MGNVIQIVLKYGQYLKFLPLLVSIVRFVRAAEGQFRGAGSGAEKAEWVRSQLGNFVDMAESLGLIGPKFAASIRDGALQLITVFVQGIKDVEGSVPPLTDTGALSTPSTAPIPIEQVLTEQPDFNAILPGHDVYQKGEESLWIVKPSGAGVGKPAEPWRVVFAKN